MEKRRNARHSKPIWLRDIIYPSKGYILTKKEMDNFLSNIDVLNELQHK